MNEFSVLEFMVDNNKKYEVELIWDSIVYIKKADKHLQKLYYLIVWKVYPKENNI